MGNRQKARAMRLQDQLAIIGILSFGSGGLQTAVFAQAVTPLVAPTLAPLAPLTTTDSNGNTRVVSGTINQTVSSGSKASLTFGSSTSFGASANLSGTGGTTTQVESSVRLATPVSASDNNRINTSLGGSNSSITANISNLRANGNTLLTDGTIGELRDGNYSNGNASLTGVNASNQIVLSPGETKFSVMTSTVGDKAIGTTSQDPVRVSSGSASAIINSQTTVDINTNQFVSTFQQAF